MKGILILVGLIVVALCVLIWAFASLPAGNSVTATVDAETGCQYLTTPAGGITPRLGVDGRQICTAGEDETL